MTHRWTFIVALVTSLATGIVTAVVLRPGILVEHDGWYFWQGSVSLLLGHGYHTFYRNEPIISWVPLYPLVLAGCQKILGVSGRSLALVNIGLAALCAFTWSLLIHKTFRNEIRELEPTSRVLVIVAVAIYLATFLPTQYLMPLSETLEWPLLAMLIIFSMEAGDAKSNGGFCLHLFLASLTLAALLLIHNTAVSYIVPALALIWLRGKLTDVAKLLFSALAIAAATVPYVIVRLALGQNSSHSVGFGRGRFTAWEYAGQAMIGMVDLLGKFAGPVTILAVIGSVGWAICSARSSRTASGAIRASLLGVWGFAVISFLLLYLMFNLTFLGSELNGRFLVPLALAIISAAIICAARLRSRLLLVTVLASLTVPSALRTVKYMQYSLMGRDALVHLPFGKYEVCLIRPNYAIHPTVLDPNCAKLGNLVIVAPPDFHDEVMVHSDTKPARTNSHVRTDLTEK